MEQSFGNRFVLGLCVGAMALAACGDDDGDGDTDAGPVDMGRADSSTPVPPPPADMGMPDEDTGPPADMGPADMGGPMPLINVRVAHLVANGPNIKVCMSVAGAGTDTFVDIGPPVTEALAPDGIPYRGISNYNTALFETGRDYRLRLYAGPALTGMCPPTADDDGALFRFTLQARDDDSGDINVGGFYTLAATGLAPDAMTGALPNVCGLLLNGPCTPGTDRTMGQVGIDVQLFEDPDPSDVSEDNVTVRMIGGSPNAPPLTVCFDPDGPMDMPAVPLGLNGVRFGTASAFVEVPMDVTEGFLAVFPVIGSDMDPTDCQTLAATGPSYVPIPLPVPAAVEAMAERIDCTFRVGRRYSVFTAGIADNDMMAEPTDTTVIPWRDSGEDMDTSADDGCPEM